jgi:putative oxidoreductase
MGRTKGIVVWVLCALLAGLYVFAGLPKVMGAAQPVEGFRAMGYSDGFRIFIGLAELAGGVGLLIPALATWAGAGLAIIMVGAVYTHLVHTPPLQALPALVCFGLLLFIAHARRGQALFLAK